jgi:2-methylcitrate dehydratase PrpD
MRLQGHFPKNADEAQYGLAFPVAALLARGQVGPNEVTGEGVHAADILAISQRVDIVEAKDLSARFPEEILSRVTIQLNDGRELQSPITQAKGDPATAMTEEEMLDKFIALARISLHNSEVIQIFRVLDELEVASSCESLIDLLTLPTRLDPDPSDTRLAENILVG